MMLKDKTIVITGATRGIGRATALLCAEEGADVGINYYRHLEGAEELAAELQEKFGRKAYLLPFDVRDGEAIKFACDELLDGGVTIQGWVNNAGVNLPGLLLTQTDAEIREQIDTNLLGPINCCKYILEHMLERKSGNIVNVGSVTRSKVFRGQAVYAATKGAVASLTLALANEYGRKGIRVNCVEPGPVQTEMFATSEMLGGEELKKRTALGRFGLAQEIAELIVFLLSDRAAYTTGGLFKSDGGYSFS